MIAAAIGQLAVRIIWRIHVAQSWRERKRRRQARMAARRGDRVVEQPRAERSLVGDGFVEGKEREPGQTT